MIGRVEYCMLLLGSVKPRAEKWKHLSLIKGP